MALTKAADGDWTSTGLTVINKNTTVNLASTSYTNDGIVDVKGATLNVNDTDFGTEADNGMINKGLMIADHASFISFSTVVGGPGDILINPGGTVYLRSQTGVSFSDPTSTNGSVTLAGGTLEFGGSNEFYATILAMTRGSQIELLGSSNYDGIASLTVTHSGGFTTLTANNGLNGGGAFTGRFLGNYSDSDFTVSNSGGNSFITRT